MKASEAQEQQAVVEWLEEHGYPVYHVPNGGRRDPKEAAHLKAQGVRAGVPDLCVPVARGGYHSLYIEMKAKGGKPTEKQVEWIRRLRAQGMCAWCCEGAGNALALIQSYMDETLDGRP